MYLIAIYDPEFDLPERRKFKKHLHSNFPHPREHGNLQKLWRDAVTRMYIGDSIYKISYSSYLTNMRDTPKQFFNGVIYGLSAWNPGSRKVRTSVQLCCHFTLTLG